MDSQCLMAVTEKVYIWITRAQGKGGRNYMWVAIVIIVAVLVFIGWGSRRKGRLGHWVRVAVMFLSAGFIFPHVFTEDIDTANKDTGQDAKVKKQ